MDCFIAIIDTTLALICIDFCRHAVKNSLCVVKMKIAVFGASGQTGSAVLQNAVQREGLCMTAFVRTPSKLPENIREKVNVVTGDVLNPENVFDALKGHDAVISCIGVAGFGSTVLYSQGMQNIVDGMRKCNVKYLCLIGGSMLLPGNSSVIKHVLPVVKDVEAMIEYIKEVDDLIWMAVMPPTIIKGEFTGNYKIELNKVPGPGKVTYPDLADCLLMSIIDQSKMNEEYKHKLFGISSMMVAEFPCLLL